MIISIQIKKVIPIPAKPSKTFQARFTNMISYDYIWETVRTVQREREDTIGSCTIGEALLFVFKSFNNGLGTKKINEDKIVPNYYNLERLKEINDWVIQAEKGFVNPMKWLEKEIFAIMTSEKDIDVLKELAIITDKPNRLIFINEYLNKLYKKVETFLEGEKEDELNKT